MVTDGELWVHKLEIPEYAMGNVFNHPVKELESFCCTGGRSRSLPRELRRRGSP